MPSGTDIPNRNPQGGRRQSRGNPKKAILQSEAVFQDTSSQSAQPERRRTPRKRASSKKPPTPDQPQIASPAAQLASITIQDAAFDGLNDLPAPPSQDIPIIQGKPNKPQTNDRRVSSTPKRNNRSPRPEHRGSDLMTPIKFNNTPPVQAYAGPTFHASPVPSALPIPRLFSKSVPIDSESTNMKGMVQDLALEVPSNKNDDSPTTANTIQVNEAPVREASPLDIFFNADRAEKARRAAANNASSPLARNTSYPVDIPQSVSPIPEYMRNHSKQNTGGSIGGGMFPLEMDASEKAASHPNPIPRLRESNRSESSPSRLSSEQAKAKTEAMKEFLRISQAKGNMPLFPPATPTPLRTDVERRLAELEGYLNSQDPRYQPPEQHLNIRKVIELYKLGAIVEGEQVCVSQGRIIPMEEMFRTRERKWLEGGCHQRASKEI